MQPQAREEVPGEPPPHVVPRHQWQGKVAAAIRVWQLRLREAEQEEELELEDLRKREQQ